MIRFSVFLAIITLLASCKNKELQTQPTEKNITQSVYASGIVKSKNQYQVFSAANGIVAQVLVTEGDTIKKDQALIKLTNTTAQLNTESAHISANYSTVAANAEKLEELKNAIHLSKIKMEEDALLLQRQKNLWAQQIGTRSELEQKELAYQSSANAYQAANLQYATLQKQLNFSDVQSKKNLQISKNIFGDYTIKSQAKGKVYSLLKKVGEMVNTQSPVAIVGDDTAFELQLQVDEYDIAKIKLGQKIVLTMDSYKGQVFEAVVEKIYPFMNDRSKSFSIDATFTNPPPKLYPNLTCEANIIIEQKQKALTIPRSFLIDSNFVLLKNNKKIKVTTGIADYQKVEILKGLTTSDILIKPAK